jgi:hypothetical protein
MSKTDHLDRRRTYVLGVTDDMISRSENLDRRQTYVSSQDDDMTLSATVVVVWKCP